MAEQAEAGDVGAAGGAVVAQDARGGQVRFEHRGDGGVDPAALGVEPHFGGEESADAERFGEDERLVRGEAAFAEEAVRVDQAVAGHGQCRHGAFGGVPAEQQSAHGRKFGGHAAEQLVEHLLSGGRGAEWDKRGGERAVRLGPHGKDVAKPMQRGDPSENKWVAHESRQVVGCLHQ